METLLNTTRSSLEEQTLPWAVGQAVSNVPSPPGAGRAHTLNPGSRDSKTI